MVIPTARDLAAAVGGRSPEYLFELTVERDGERRQVPVRGAGAGLGAFVETRDLRAVLPFQISFVDRPDIGGPSAGLAYALAINDMLDATDDARSRSIAATGTIDASGRVGDVAGVAEKVVAAKHAGATLLIVPDAALHDVDLAAIATSSVTDLREALRVLTAT